MNPEQLKSLIEAGIPDAQVTVRDIRGTGDHFRVEVTSPSFAGLTLIRQHQMVYAAVGEEMTNAVHALSIHTATPQE
jgi:stress-induced morphogen